MTPTPDPLREAAKATADWLDHVQMLYHSIVQRMSVNTRDTCNAGMCGDYRQHRDALRAALVQPAPALDVARLEVSELGFDVTTVTGRPKSS